MVKGGDAEVGLWAQSLRNPVWLGGYWLFRLELPVLCVTAPPCRPAIDGLDSINQRLSGGFFYFYNTNESVILERHRVVEPYKLCLLQSLKIFIH
jgi:hypothetical protein